MATWRGSAIEGQALQPSIQVVLDEPSGHPHGLTREPGIRLGEVAQIGASQSSEIPGQPGPQGHRPGGAILLAQHAAGGEREPGETVGTAATRAVLEGRCHPDDVGRLE